jgi:hypothetical protein
MLAKQCDVCGEELSWWERLWGKLAHSRCWRRTIIKDPFTDGSGKLPFISGALLSFMERISTFFAVVGPIPPK